MKQNGLDASQTQRSQKISIMHMNFWELVTCGSIFIQYAFVHVSHVLKSFLFSSLVHVELFQFSIEKLDLCLIKLIGFFSSVFFFFFFLLLLLKFTRNQRMGFWNY